MNGSWTWRKSSASDTSGTQCVEVAWTGHTVLVRDSKEPARSHLCFAPTVWGAFLASRSSEEGAGKRA
ncbi:DUF397 domain-containing protein [Streptomyces phaeochromogenes]|uniref:DUF397 domain-containing protein n=1 Tax=Streptomyces phaeochromogenes TaxID=1923 RepID=UPI002F90F770|nr:DUF397 domain-containing protein [Streptomyces phaeochromogenes]